MWQDLSLHNIVLVGTNWGLFTFLQLVYTHSTTYALGMYKMHLVYVLNVLARYYKYSVTHTHTHTHTHTRCPATTILYKRRLSTVFVNVVTYHPQWRWQGLFVYSLPPFNTPSSGLWS